MRKFILFAVLLATGCTTLNTQDYRPDGKDPVQAQQDAAICDSKAKAARDAAGGQFMDSVLALNAQYNKAFDACMQELGHEKR